MRDRSALRLLPLLVFVGLAAACSGGGGGGTGAGFQLTRISLLEGDTLKVNEEILFTFSQPISFASVSLNTISIKTLSGAPATGSFQLRTPNQVAFQPNCPTLDGLTDTGLRPDSQYEIVVVGTSPTGATNTVRSAGGALLGVTQVRHFSTPSPTTPGQLFQDKKPNQSPEPVLREQGSSELQATYLEVGGDPDNRVYFELDPLQNLVLSVPGFEAPLNMYSDPATRLAVVIEFDQAVNPSSDNISSDRVRLEFLAFGGTWVPLGTRVTLLDNCSETGASVRLEPIGIVPPESKLRAVVLPSFEDLVSETNTQSQVNFAVTDTAAVVFTSLTPDDQKSDQLPESFDFGGEDPLSNQDTAALFGSPVAEWGDGLLESAFQFDGTGGPGGAFDWLVKSTDDLILDTDQDTLTGADGVTIQEVVGGVLNVRNLTIQAGGTVRVQGPNPLRINATGDVAIRGLLDLSGFDADDVSALNSGDVLEEGAEGAAGGGKGGNANEVLTNSTARGSRGQGPFGEVNTGGQGGETGFSAAINGKDARRPGGGGGGRFARDQGTLVAQAGSDGSPLATSAVTGTIPPKGGLVGAGSFPNIDNRDDLFGLRPIVEVGVLTELLQGELPSLWAGYGGGGGGNANPSAAFPTPNWTRSSDEKGGAGGGGGGALHIRALGKIIFGSTGQIVCDGGEGGLGENTLLQDHVGGSGGSGSGGHVILETASFIDFTDGNPLLAAHECVRAAGGPQVQGPATTGGPVSFGGAGGPGVLQVHVPNTLLSPSNSPLTSDIIVPNASVGSVDPLDDVMSPPGIVAIPEFGAKSQARSDWISIGGADQKPDGSVALLQFLFGGIQTAAGPDEGKVITTNGVVQPLPELLDEDLEGSSTLTLEPDRVTVTVSGTSLDVFLNGTTSGLSNDLYLRSPTLLENFALVLELAEDPDTNQEFTVGSAVYDEGATLLGDEELRITVADEGAGDLQDFVTANTGAGTIHLRLVPRYFRVTTGGVPDALPDGSYVRILFQAARDDGSGTPQELTPFVADISSFNGLIPGDLQFFRFEVEFELDALGTGVTADTDAVSLQFLSVPFVF